MSHPQTDLILEELLTRIITIIKKSAVDTPPLCCLHYDFPPFEVARMIFSYNCASFKMLTNIQRVIFKEMQLK